jgi:hypothetical protein
MKQASDEQTFRRPHGHNLSPTPDGSIISLQGAYTQSFDTLAMDVASMLGKSPMNHEHNGDILGSKSAGFVLCIYDLHFDTTFTCV